jgi:hypothetical protein
MLWDGSSEEIDAWLKEVLSGKRETKTELIIKDSEVEG